jgi:hypothetical protein
MICGGGGLSPGETRGQLRLIFVGEDAWNAEQAVEHVVSQSQYPRQFLACPMANLPEYGVCNSPLTTSVVSLVNLNVPLFADCIRLLLKIVARPVMKRWLDYSFWNKQRNQPEIFSNSLFFMIACSFIVNV